MFLSSGNWYLIFGGGLKGGHLKNSLRKGAHYTVERALSFVLKNILWNNRKERELTEENTENLKIAILPKIN